MDRKKRTAGLFSAWARIEDTKSRIRRTVEPAIGDHHSAHHAVEQARAFVIEGYRFVVDIDLARFSGLL